MLHLRCNRYTCFLMTSLSSVSSLKNKKSVIKTLILTEYKYTFVKGTVSLWSVVNDKACMCIPLSFLNLNDAFKTLLRMVKPPKPWDSTETSLG